MPNSLKKLMVNLMVITLAAMLVPQSALAQSHVVKPEDLQKALLDASNARKQNITAVEELFSTEQAQSFFRKAGMDHSKAIQAISLLEDEELAQLAAKAKEIQTDFAAGEISDRTMLYVIIVVGVGALIAFLIIMP
jgi:hypothetical protein